MLVHRTKSIVGADMESEKMLLVYSKSGFEVANLDGVVEACFMTGLGGYLGFPTENQWSNSILAHFCRFYRWAFTANGRRHRPSTVFVFILLCLGSEKSFNPE